MGRKKAVIYKGKRYSSLAEFMRLKHIPINKRYTLVDTLELKTEQPYKVHNHFFNSLREVADFYQVKFSQMRRGYFKQGLKLEYIIDRLQKGLPIKLKRNLVIDHLGREFVSKGQMCAYYGISRTTFDRRKAKGLNLKQCLTSPKKGSLKNANK